MSSIKRLINKRSARGENTKYLRDNKGDKMNPVMEIKADEGEGPYSGFSGTGPSCDIVFSFDTTGSMSSVLESVRKNLSETVAQEISASKLLRKYPNLKLVGKSQQNNIIFESNTKRIKVTPKGSILWVI